MKKSIKKISCLISLALIGSSFTNISAGAKNLEVDEDIYVESASDNGLCDYYMTNPNGQVGKEKTITSIDDFTSDMLIAQSAVNDDPRAYRATEYGGSMHEKPVDTYQIYAAWDDSNVYLMWIMTNVTDVEAPDQNYPISDNGKPWNGDLCQMLLFNVDSSRGGSGVTSSTDKKTGTAVKGSNLWGVRVNFETKIDKVAMIHSNSTGEQAIFSLNADDEFDYDTATKITNGKTATTGTRFTWVDGLPSCVNNLWGMKGWASSRKTGDMVDGSGEWVDYLTTSHSKMQDTTYLMTIPYEDLGITKNDLTSKGLGVMHVTTFGLSGMDSCPYDITMNDAAADPCPQDPSTSGEKEDIDTITAPLASIGMLRNPSNSSTSKPMPSITTDVKGEQPINKKITFTTKVANGKAPYTYQYYVDDKKVGEETDSEIFEWTPTKAGDYTIKVIVKDADGTKGQKEKKMSIVAGNASSDVEDDEKPSTGEEEKPSTGVGEDDKTDGDNKDDNTTNDDDSTPETSQLKTGKITVSGDKEVSKEVKFTASATGGDGNYKYKYVIKDENGDEVDSRAYAKDANFTWIPKNTGTYAVSLEVKDGDGNNDSTETTVIIKESGDSDSGEKPSTDSGSGSSDENTDSLEELIITEFTASKKTDIEVGSKVKFNVKASGGSGNYKYKLVIDGKSSDSYLTSSTLYYTPDTVGTHKVKVVVVDEDTDEGVFSDDISLKVVSAANDNDENENESNDDSKPVPSGDVRSISLAVSTLLLSLGFLVKKRKVGENK